MEHEDEALDAKLKLFVDDEHRVVDVGAPDGLAGMTDAQVLALLRRAAALRGQYEAAGYVVTFSTSEHPKWRPADPW